MNGIRMKLAGYRRRLAIGLLLVGMVLLGATAWMWVQYLTTKQVPDLPLATKALGLNQPLYAYSIYGVDKPLAVAVSPDGQRVYVTEGGGDRLIRIVDPKGYPLGSFFTGESETASRKPMYVAVSPEGLVYVTDLERPGIDVFSSQGEFHTTIMPKLGEGETWQPLALAFDEGGKLYVTDSSSLHPRVLVFDQNGTVERQIQGNFAYPNGIVVDRDGRILVADSNNGRIQIFGADGQLIGIFDDSAPGLKLALPRGLALDLDGRLLVVDTFDHSTQVFRVDSSSKFQFGLGEQGFGDGQFSYPNSLAIDNQGHIYIADRENNRVQIWF